MSSLAKDFSHVAVAMQKELLVRGVRLFKTQSELARRAGLPRQTVSKYYRGEIEMKHSMYLYLQSVIEKAV
jgi:predicted transcriptional regulator